MLFWEKLKNSCTSIGLARAASQLSAQGHHEEAKNLMIYGYKEVAKQKEAIKRLERVKKAKSEYEPGDHYMRGHKVAFWKGHADA